MSPAAAKSAKNRQHVTIIQVNILQWHNLKTACRLLEQRHKHRQLTYHLVMDVKCIHTSYHAWYLRVPLELLVPAATTCYRMLYACTYLAMRAATLSANMFP